MIAISAWRPLARLARWQLDRGDARGALRSARRAIRLVARPGVADRDRGHVEWLLGRALLCCGAHGEAIGVLKHVVVDPAQRPLVARDLASALARVGRYDEAEDVACAVLVGEPVSQEVDGTVCMVLGDCASGRGDHEVAMGWYRQAEAALRSHDHDHPALADLWQARAALALDRGDTLTALSWARLGQWHRSRHAANGQTAIAHDLLQLAEILAATGQLDAAEAELAQATPIVTRSGGDADRARASFVAAVVHQHAGRPRPRSQRPSAPSPCSSARSAGTIPGCSRRCRCSAHSPAKRATTTAGARYERDAQLVLARPNGGSARERPALQLVREPLAA